MTIQSDTSFSSSRNMIRVGDDFDVLGYYLDFYCLNIDDFYVEINEGQSTNLTQTILQLDTFVIENEIEYLGLQKKEDSYIDEFPAFSVPLFDHPDTICTDSPLLFEKLQNTGADSVVWTLLGSNMEQTYEFEPAGIKYDKEGQYSIIQTVYQNGCANSYESSIAVLKPVSNFSNDTLTLCRDATVRLNVETEDALSYLWDDGSSSSEKLVTNPGIHTVEINNESCRQEINFHVEPFDYSLIAINLGEDTIICKEIPFILQPTLHEDGAFIWSDGEERLERYIEETGFYELTTSLNGCSTKSEIFVEVDSCSTQVYIPNSFSPNDDGVNDVFQPLGDDFEIVDFKVFDRWGNLVHDDIIPWTGDKLGRDFCPQGIYVFLLSIRNKRLNVDELFKGSVTLLR